MFKRLLIVSAFGLALASCGADYGGGRPLEWRSSVDVPMNFSRKVDAAPLFPESGCELLADEYLEPLLPEGVGCEDLAPGDIARLLQGLSEPPPPQSYLIDLGADTVSTSSDAVNILRKLRDPDIAYWIGAANGTEAALTFYGMLFPESDGAAGLSAAEYYGLVAKNDTSGGRVNIFGRDGLRVGPDSTMPYSMPPGQGEPLCNLVIRSKALAWRWLVRLDAAEYGALNDTAKTADNTVSIKLRMRFSGVNSFDSLFAQR